MMITIDSFLISIMLTKVWLCTHYSRLPELYMFSVVIFSCTLGSLHARH